MSTNFVGDPLSDCEIRQFADDLRRHQGLRELDIPDVVAELKRESIYTRFGQKRLGFQIVADEDLGGDEALTLITDVSVKIRVARSIFDRASSLDRRARMTIAHELGHGVLHRNSAPLARSKVVTAKRFVPHYVSVERQASVFASDYLVSRELLGSVTSPSELARVALISGSAADLIWEKAENQKNRVQIQAGLKALSEELRYVGEHASLRQEPLQCPVCSQHTLVPITGRFLCHGPCNRVYDSFPDGD